MGFKELEKKGLGRFLIDEGIPEGRLSIHRSRLEAGTRSHGAHVHEGVEGFVVLEGTAAVESGGEEHRLGPFESMVVDCSAPHGIRNASDGPLEYVVVISK